MEELATKIGVRWQTVQQWEKSNGTAPNRKRMPAVAKALGLSQEYLVSGKNTSYSVTEPSHSNYLTPNKHIDQIIQLLESMDDIGVGRVLQAAKDAAKDHPKGQSKTA